MKRQYFLLSAVLALCVTACTGNKPDNSQPDSKPKNEPAVTPTTEVAFAELTDDDLCMVPSYVKSYIDQMKEQETQLTFPNRVDSLFCNMSWSEAAGKSDKGDGTTYSDAESGGVDVCQLLSRSQKYECKPLEIKWESNEDFAGGKVLAWSREDKSDMREFAVEADGASAKLINLFRNTKYYFQVVDADETNASQMGNFVTGDYTRMITMGDISNVRDMGGYQTSYGGRINQGYIYRGGEMAPADFTDGSNRHSKNWTDAAQEVQTSTLNIGLELDLRTKSGSGNMTESPLAFDGDWEFENTYPNPSKENANGRAQYVRCAINSYDSLITDPNRKSEADNANRNLVKEIFEYLANADKQHVYFHCWGGADRTGVTGFLLLGILGASYTDAIIDFELTTLTNNKRCHMHNSQNAHMPKFLNQCVSGYTFTRDGEDFKYEFDPDATLNVNSTNLLLAMGVEMETIEKIRSFMIPNYQPGMEEVEQENKPWSGLAKVIENLPVCDCCE